jgi:hypothetical protein
MLWDRIRKAIGDIELGGGGRRRKDIWGVELGVVK